MNAIFKHALGKFVGKSWWTFSPFQITMNWKTEKKIIEVAPIIKISLKDLNRKFFLLINISYGNFWKIIHIWFRNGGNPKTMSLYNTVV